MTDICLVFMVHQPLRLNRSFFKELMRTGRLSDEDRLRLYFDHNLDLEVLNRVSDRCYLPANRILLSAIDRHGGECKEARFAFSLSGVFLEHCSEHRPDVLESFKDLAQTGCVEFIGQTYYHSLASLYSAKRQEFIEQVELHRSLIEETFSQTPTTFENTELIYNDSIAETVWRLGFKAILAEGVERVLGGRSPNYLYRASKGDLKVLLRSYRLSDDIGFRFSSQTWSQWPLTADRYAYWLASTPGECINIFLDYETFGEHHWPATGILEFLKALPDRILEYPHLEMSTPIEVATKHNAIGEFQVPDYETISWADIEKDLSAWLGNELQWNCYGRLRSLEAPAKLVQDPMLLRLWRYLQVSDHLHHISTKAGGAGDVHSYFSPYGSPLEAFTTLTSLTTDLEYRLAEELATPSRVAARLLMEVPREKAFNFFLTFAKPLRVSATSLEQLVEITRRVDIGSITFHLSRGDLERWLRDVVGDGELAEAVSRVSRERLKGEELRKALVETIDRRVLQLRERTKHA